MLPPSAFGQCCRGEHDYGDGQFHEGDALGIEEASGQAETRECDQPERVPSAADPAIQQQAYKSERADLGKCRDSWNGGEVFTSGGEQYAPLQGERVVQLLFSVAT